jgi:phosphate/phosphite/phosphonate ABC transporter binding protein
MDAIPETKRIERFGLAPSAGPERVGKYIRPLADYLASRLGDQLQFSILKSFSEVSEALQAGKISFAWLSPLTYAWAAEGVQLLLRSVRADSGSYYSVLFALEASELRGPRDLYGRRIGWVSRDSMAGYVLPVLALREKTIVPGDEFFLGSHAAVVRSVMSGAVDAGATFCSVNPRDEPVKIVSAGWTETVEVGPNRFRTLGIYGPIPGDVLCAAPGVPEPMRERFVDAMLHIHEQPGGREIVRGLFGADRFSEAEPGEYLKLRLAVDQLPGLKD